MERRKPGSYACCTAAQTAGGHAGEQVVVGDRSGYRLAVTADQLDLLQLRELVNGTSQGAPEQDLARLAEAVTLWRGEPDVASGRESPLDTALRNEFTRAVGTFVALARELAKSELAFASIVRDCHQAGPGRDVARRADSHAGRVWTAD